MTTKKGAGFTLIELLVVIGIIAVLASMLLPAVMRAIGAAEKAQARTEVKAIENALRVYLSDYNKFPQSGSCQLQTTGAGQTDADLINSLRGINTNADANPRAFVYLDANEKSLGTNVVTATGGQGVVGAMYDPWGNFYKIAVDYQFNNSIPNGAADGESLSARTVAVWSWGPNNKSTSPDPNDITHVRSWR